MKDPKELCEAFQCFDQVSWVQRGENLLKTGYMFTAADWRRSLRGVVELDGHEDETFLEQYRRTGMALNISVSIGLARYIGLAR